MDRIVATYEYEEAKDLRICHKEGIAYQWPMNSIKYDKSYFDKCGSYENSDIANAINAARIDVVDRYCGSDNPVLDIGIGCGEFIKKRNGKTYGIDVNKDAINWLKEKDLYSADFDKFNAFTMWDVLEHCVLPEKYFIRFKSGSFLFVSIPIFKDLNKIKKSKHYRPNEHLYYFTYEGFVKYMKDWGFDLKEKNELEIEAGREDIYTFVFQKSEVDYGALINQYKIKHSTEHYGSSSEVYLNDILPHIQALNPTVILDYGCGRSSLATYFWNDGKRLIYRYDPAIPTYKTRPVDKADLILCNDVLEHIFKRDLDRFIQEVKSVSKNVIFSVSTIPARAKLSNGLNAHVTIESKDWWVRFLEKHFPRVIIIKDEDHGFLCKTFKS